MNTLQLMERKPGKKGGNYFTQGKSDKDAERRENAERDLGATPAHGSSHPGQDAGINAGTTNHEAKVVAHMRAQKEKEYKDSRPKPLIKNQSAKTPFQKAFNKALEMKASGAGLGDFMEYLEARGYSDDDLSAVELNQLYALFD
jgi:hypothetical protein